MLWYKREQLATEIATAMAPVMQAVFRSTGRTDVQLFGNPFLCGFVSGSFFALRSILSTIPVNPNDVGDIEVRVFKKLIGGEWQTASDHLLRYIKLGDRDCVRGSEAAQGFWAVSYALIELDSDALLREFRKKSESVYSNNKMLGLESPRNENEAVASLMMTHILEEIAGGQAWDEI